jgi:RES domain-containing protein
LPADASVEEVRPADLPGWDAVNRRASQRFGDRWYDDARSLILLVPSLAAPGLERNVLINQRHPDFARVTTSKAEPVRCHPNFLA